MYQLEGMPMANPRTPIPAPHAQPKAGIDRDPHVTPWEEEEALQPMRPPPRQTQRGLRDWLVLGAGAILLIYVISFLFLGTDSSRSSSGFTFGQPSVAIIPIHGEIVSGTSGNFTGYMDIMDQLEQADNDPSVSVVLLDIDSGGGSVVASKQMVATIRSMDKPVVSWVGELGASGAYYAAAASDYIVADSDSITGSIGVISRQPNVKVLLEKLGISMDEVTSGKLKGVGSPFDEFTEEEKQLFQVLVNQAFEGFVDDIKAFRGDKLNQLQFSEVLDGRILSGKQALEIGLIDQTGTRKEAIMKAAELGGIKGKPGLVSYVNETFSFSDLFFSAGASFGEGFRTGIGQEVETDAGLSAK